MSQITITGLTGPGQALTASVLQDVNGLDFQFDRKVVGVRYGSPERTTYIEYANIATVTFTISGVNTTVVMSS